MSSSIASSSSSLSSLTATPLNLYRVSLPNYTTERYYILSEIEECSDIVTLEELSSNKQDYDDRKIDVIHFLWDQTNESVVDFINRIGKFVDGLTKLETKKKVLSTVQILTDENHKKVLVGDILLPHEIELKHKFEESIKAVIECLKSVSYVTKVAVSDHSSSTAALESGHDWVISVIEQAGLQQATKEKMGRLLVGDRSDCLGFDDREPDAENNVFQVLYSSKSDYDIQQICRTVADAMRGRKDEYQKPVPIGKAQYNYIINWVILLIAVAIAIYLSGFSTRPL